MESLVRTVANGCTDHKLIRYAKSAWNLLPYELKFNAFYFWIKTWYNISSVNIKRLQNYWRQFKFFFTSMVVTTEIYSFPLQKKPFLSSASKFADCRGTLKTPFHETLLIRLKRITTEVKITRKIVQSAKIQHIIDSGSIKLNMKFLQESMLAYVYFSHSIENSAQCQKGLDGDFNHQTDHLRDCKVLCYIWLNIAIQTVAGKETFSKLLVLPNVRNLF